MRQCAGEAQTGNLAQASYQAGWADCAEVIRRSVEDRRSSQPETEDTTAFVDPAMRKSMRMKIVDSGGTGTGRLNNG